MLVLLAASTLVLSLVPPQTAPAGPLELTLGETQLLQTNPRPVDTFVRVPIITTSQQGSLEVVSADGFPIPLRSPCWTVAGAYGLSSVFGSMAAILTEAFIRSSNKIAGQRNTTANAVGMALGALVGLAPGALLGNESRKEQNGLGRGVTAMLDLGGTLALVFAINQSFNTKSIF